MLDTTLDTMLETLISEYEDWISEQGLALMSADELLAEGGLTVYQSGWLQDFIERWEIAEEQEDEEEIL